MIESPVMAGRPEIRRQEILTEQDLKAIKNHLAMLSRPHVEAFYDESHRECCWQEKGLPAARSIQQLVTAWKQLRKWRP